MVGVKYNQVRNFIKQWQSHWYSAGMNGVETFREDKRINTKKNDTSNFTELLLRGDSTANKGCWILPESRLVPVPGHHVSDGICG